MHEADDDIDIDVNDNILMPLNATSAAAAVKWWGHQRQIGTVLGHITQTFEVLFMGLTICERAADSVVNRVTQSNRSCVKAHALSVSL